MFNQTYTKQNNANQGVNVNSSIKASMGGLSRLRFALWNQQITLTINPAIGTDPQTGLPTYDNGRAIKAFINLPCAEVLKKGIEEKINPEIRKVIKGEPFEEVSVGAECGSSKKNMVTIELVKKDDGNPVVKLGIYPVSNESFAADLSSSFVHEFPNERLFIGYNPQTGSSVSDAVISGDFEIFVDMLNNLILATGMNDHGARYGKVAASSFTQNSGGNNQGSSYNANNTGVYNASAWASNSGSNMDELPFN